MPCSSEPAAVLAPAGSPVLHRSLLYAEGVPRQCSAARWALSKQTQAAGARYARTPKTRLRTGARPPRCGRRRPGAAHRHSRRRCRSSTARAGRRRRPRPPPWAGSAALEPGLRGSTWVRSSSEVRPVPESAGALCKHGLGGVPDCLEACPADGGRHERCRARSAGVPACALAAVAVPRLPGRAHAAAQLGHAVPAPPESLRRPHLLQAAAANVQESLNGCMS